MRLPRNAKIFRGQLDAAPFACVFFLLAMFFLVNFRLVFTSGVPIQLPSSSERLPGTTEAVAVVAVDAEGGLYWEGQLTQPDALHWRLREAVKQAREPLTLIIQADERTALKHVLRLMAVAPGLGFTNAQYLMNPAQPNLKPGVTTGSAAK